MTGLRVIESVHATALPSGTPFTDDMRDMVEHFDKLGLIQRVPAAFRTPSGLVVHPNVMNALRANVAAKMDRIAERAFYFGAS